MEIINKAKKPTVVIGMSGGVDSSVAAYLLKEQGYDVIGVTMQIWQQEDSCIIENNGGCCGWSAVEDAKRVAAVLDIPHYVMNFRDEFKNKVIDNFVEEYVAGKTPNPCIRCNRFVKWESLLKRSMEIGAEYIATGHYARIKKLDNGRLAIVKAASNRKDQTYALYNLTQEQLRHTIFPIGDYDKSEVRDIARKLGLLVADKKDSQEICFIPDNDYAGFINKSGCAVPDCGQFVDTKGNVLGTHKGIHCYTIGQRKGLGIASNEPFYVCDIDARTNQVCLGKNSDVYKTELFCSDINHMGAEKFLDGQRVSAKIRYGAKEEYCRLSYVSKDCIRCDFENPVRAVTPGQAVVFYDNDIVLGGGCIQREG